MQLEVKLNVLSTSEFSGGFSKFKNYLMGNRPQPTLSTRFLHLNLSSKVNFTRLRSTIGFNTRRMHKIPESQQIFKQNRRFKIR